MAAIGNMNARSALYRDTHPLRKNYFKKIYLDMLDSFVGNSTGGIT